MNCSAVVKRRYLLTGKRVWWYHSNKLLTKADARMIGKKVTYILVDEVLNVRLSKE